MQGNRRFSDVKAEALDHLTRLVDPCTPSRHERKLCPEPLLCKVVEVTARVGFDLAVLPLANAMHVVVGWITTPGVVITRPIVPSP